jgi:hypothetical protein
MGHLYYKGFPLENKEGVIGKKKGGGNRQLAKLSGVGLCFISVICPLSHRSIRWPYLAWMSVLLAPHFEHLDMPMILILVIDGMFL